jgi:hypothetical protein
MAAPDVSTVVALSNKAFDFQYAGHRARAAEYFRRAQAAARASGAEDCLVIAILQLFESSEITASESLQHEQQGLPGEAPRSPTVVALFFAAAATVQRRKAAGTLQVGCCRPAEVTWRQLFDQHIAEVVQNAGMRRSAALLAPLVGYTAAVHVGIDAVKLVLLAEAGLVPLSQEQLHICLGSSAVNAAELILHPRVHEEFAMGLEADFAAKMRMIVTQGPQSFMQHGARLLHAWRRLEQSGVLERRHASRVEEANKRNSDAVSAAVAAAAAAPGLRQCALASCSAREQHPAHFKSCAACRVPAYCCKEHQSEDWPSHKAACKAARKAAAEDTAGDG